MGQRRILIVDDDRDILDLLEYNLEKEGYEVKTVSKSSRAVSIAKKFSPDLIILDIMMPDKNGIELCRKLRAKERFRDTYIFFLTARDESYYRHAAFHTGGDDYIEKIIGLKSLTRKISAVLKSGFIIRKRFQELVLGNVTLKRSDFSVNYDGSIFHLPKPEFELLFFFAQNPSKEISAEEVVKSIWGSETFLAESGIEIYIQNMTRKFGLPLIEKKGRHHYRLKKQSGIT